ncbi:MAG TPA: hypothetical protein VFC39_08890 [Acidobacteriaceae bacterium]|nr:hypothetical protein [Acidobacteriaceae bacterium]
MKCIAAVLTYALLVTQFAYAAQTVQAPSPQLVPAASEAAAQSRLLSAKNIYIADDGADEHFPGSATEADHAFAASLRTWGRYNLVPTAKEADLVLQVRAEVNRSYVAGSDDSYGAYVYSAFFRLTIADPATLDPLWVITVPVLTGNRKKDRADLFNVSAGNLTSQLKLLTNTPLTARETADLREPAVLSHKRTALALGLIVGVVAAGVGGGLLLHHAYENSLADQKKTADAWCTANHIPLSECAGG